MIEDLAAPGSDIEFVSTLAEGGMGRVMLARQRSLSREVAVKVIKQEVASESTVAGLLHEAVLSGSLEHPNIVPVHMLGQDEAGLPILVMKRVEGVSWATLIEKPDHPAWTPVLRGGNDHLGAHLSILGSVCDALHYAHSRGVIHRDVKPANVMVGVFGEVYLVDWGIATRVIGAPAARAGQGEQGQSGPVGTPWFMAPEMLSSRGRMDVRTDVYLLGATLHYVLTRTPRHSGKDLMAVLLAARASLPCTYGPEVPEELGAICNRATHADPRERFATAQAFRDAVADFVRHRGSVDLSDAAHERLRQLRTHLGSQNQIDADVRILHELMSESLFGFHQSLRTWAGNVRAQKGLRECLIVIIGYEIEQENLARVTSLLAELEEPPPALLFHAEALREHVREREVREARLRAIEREHDWSVSSRQRAIFFALMCAVCILIWRIAVRDQRTSPHTIPPAILALSVGCLFAVLCVLVAIFRKALFATKVTRHMVLGVLCGVGAMAINRALHVIAAPSTAGIVSQDQVLAALGTAIGAVVLARWLWSVVPIFLLGALCARLFPMEAGAIFAVTSSLSLALCIALSTGSSDAPPASPPPAVGPGNPPTCAGMGTMLTK